MSIKPTKVLLVVDDGRRDPSRLQQVISGGRSIECETVKVEHLQDTLRHSKAGNPNLILLNFDCSTALLSKTLVRVRKLAGGVPVLVLPEEWNTLEIPISAYASKSQFHANENHRQLTRLLRNGLWRPQSQLELSRLALCDDLTGLYNRRGFQMLGSQALKMAYRLKKNLLLFFADLDNLKKINDQFGHQEGDRALMIVADIFKKTFRSSDITARFGGDEFVALVIEDCGQSETTISRRLQRNMAEFAAKESNYMLSFSFGAAECFSSGRASLQKLLDEADHSLYEQKRTKLASTTGNSILSFPGTSRGRAQRQDATPSAPSVVNHNARVQEPSVNGAQVRRGLLS
jgi:two-component system cell cycle response regulator